MAGIQIDGVNNKIDFDDDADTSISSATDDTLVIESGGVNVASITAGEFAINEGSADIDFRIEGNGDPNAFFLDASVDRIYFGRGVDTDVNGFNGRLQLSGTDFDTSGMSMIRYSDSTPGPSLVFAKSRNATLGSNTIVQNGDQLGKIRFTGADGVDFGNTAGEIQCFVDGTPGENDMPGGFAFSTAADGATGVTERMRINSNGNIMVGTTTELGRLHLSMPTTAGTDPVVHFSDAGGTDCGSIDLNASANTVAYTTSSDYRLKENVNYDFDATTRLKQLKPARFNFKNNPNETVDGFLAHEVSDVVALAVTGVKDETKTKTKVVLNSQGNLIAEGIEESDWIAGKIADDDGNTEYPTDSTWEESAELPIYQGIDHSKLVPLLVKTIQELEARIATLEGN
jgi:hypothetical protein|tara:strand:- start:440 stop:1639 length:1200 start_codon:yes stop_codon:yes gene_type:complete